MRNDASPTSSTATASVPGVKDWLAWHEAYADPGSAISQRLPLVQAHVGRALEERRGRDARVVSLCSGSGADLLPVLAAHPERDRVSARLVELHPELAARARRSAAELRLDGVEVVTGDAGVTDAVAGSVPADLVLVCGVFGNVSDGDVERTIGILPQLCAEGATVIWTRHRRPPDLTPAIRSWFAAAGFAERAFDSRPGSYGVGVHELLAPPQPFRPGVRLFTFL